MGLRHVSGIKQWGGYQRAKLVVELVDDFALNLSEAAKQIGMSSHEASRRYRALKALEQMQNDEEFGTLADPKMYRLFHEAVSVVKVKDWLEWHDDERTVRQCPTIRFQPMQKTARLKRSVPK